MSCAGIGKTTLAIEICVKWASYRFLAEDFDIVALIPLRSVQERCVEAVMMEHIGEETYEQVKKSAGSRCLVILEGWDEMAAERRENDPFLVRVVKRHATLLEKAIIMITSRPHACEKVHADRKVEVVGFGKDEIQEFIERSFPNDEESVEQFSQQLKEYPHLESLSYVPMNLKMIVDIFKCSEKKLPSTITKLYQLFIVETLKQEIEKEIERKQVCSINAVADDVKKKLCEVLEGVPEETLRTLLLLCRLAYCGFFSWHTDAGTENDNFTFVWKWKDPKIIFTVADLKECRIEVTAEWDGYGLLKATHTHQLPTDTVTYNFAHLTIQEFLCAIYTLTLSQEEQQRLLSKHFSDFPNIFVFLCGLSRLESSETLQFVISKLPEINGSTSVKCLYESQMTCPLQLVTTPITLCVAGAHFLQPYDCLCISYVMSCYPVSALKVEFVNTTDKAWEFLIKHYPKKNVTGQLLEELYLNGNGYSIDGLVHIMEIIKTSKALIVRSYYFVLVNCLT